MDVIASSLDEDYFKRNNEHIRHMEVEYQLNEKHLGEIFSDRHSINKIKDPNKYAFRRLLADRDISPEKESSDDILEEDGRGATNLVRRYIMPMQSTASYGWIPIRCLCTIRGSFGISASI